MDASRGSPVIAWKDEDWKRVVDAVETPILVLDRDLRVERGNRAVSMLTGRKEHEIEGSEISSLGAGEPWRASSEAARLVATDVSPRLAQVRDEAGRTWDILAMPFDSQAPQDGRVIIIGWDVTHATELRAELDRQEKMSLMGSLVAGVAHEVRSPLFAISATVDALEQRIGDAHREYFEVLREEVDRMTELMQDLLEFGRPSPVVRQNTQAGQLIQGAIAATRTLAQTSGVSVILEGCASDADLFVDVDKVRRALENVIGNAIQHSREGGRVMITCNEVREHGRKCVEITVADEGPGIRAEDLPHLFEPFFSRRKGGTGLGLSIVNRTLEEHRGEIRAMNRAEGGAAFVIRIPAAPSSEGART